MNRIVDTPAITHDAHAPPMLAAAVQTLDAFDVIPGPYSVTARRQLEAINRLIRRRSERRLARREGKGFWAHDMPEKMLALYSRHPELLEEPPGGADVVTWIREARDDDHRG
ncbi:hypothetical protein CDN99_22265 [Roseateles aquatilis]|uniref:Uncharacterized protein n=1 Tax=Roseateles aquatilis TaxID=431061 RepID=A0A2D0AM23_9BURK|nr:hypothetical protein [Roseateles aquatilis]OWQ85268.1 hypothetical protein CDN99_22265 [Roseateles aquatilis]